MNANMPPVGWTTAGVSDGDGDGATQVDGTGAINSVPNGPTITAGENLWDQARPDRDDDQCRRDGRAVGLAGRAPSPGVPSLAVTARGPGRASRDAGGWRRLVRDLVPGGRRGHFRVASRVEPRGELSIEVAACGHRTQLRG